jgi:hypothetical protein
MSTFELIPKLQQPHGLGHRYDELGRDDVREMPSLSNLALQAMFKGYGRWPKWGALKALVDIQRKWIVLRLLALVQAAELIAETLQGKILGYTPINTYADVRHMRRYRRLQLALRTSQARVHTMAITQRV